MRLATIQTPAGPRVTFLVNRFVAIAWIGLVAGVSEMAALCQTDKSEAKGQSEQRAKQKSSDNLKRICRAMLDYHEAFQVLLFDGTVRFLRWGFDEGVFRAAVTHNGRERLDWDKLYDVPNRGGK